MEEVIEWAVENPFKILAAQTGVTTAAVGTFFYSVKEGDQAATEVIEKYNEFDSDGDITREELHEEYWDLVGDGVPQYGIKGTICRPEKSRQYAKYLQHREERFERNWEI